MKKVKIISYRSERSAIGEIGGKQVIVRIPVNVIPPIPGSEVGAQYRGTVKNLVAAVKGAKPELVDEEVYVYIHDAK